MTLLKYTQTFIKGITSYYIPSSFIFSRRLVVFYRVLWDFGFPALQDHSPTTALALLLQYRAREGVLCTKKGHLQTVPLI